MRKLAFGAMFAGAFGLMACGSEPEQPPIVNPVEDAGTDEDAAPTPDAPPAMLACDPVAAPGEEGCAAGEKCGFLVLVDDGVDFVGQTACVPLDAAPALLDEACQFGMPGPDTGFDNCDTGLTCRAGTCAQTCTIEPDSCEAGLAQCARYTTLYTDAPNPPEGTGLGVCDAICDANDPRSCDPGSSCYMNIFQPQPEASCAVIAGDVQQGEVCQFLNECEVEDIDGDGLPDRSASCMQLIENGQPPVCANHCDTTDQMADLLCEAIPQIANGTPRCVPLNGYYGDLPLDMRFGMCVDCADPRIAMFTVCQNMP